MLFALKSLTALAARPVFARALSQAEAPSGGSHYGVSRRVLMGAGSLAMASASMASPPAWCAPSHSRSDELMALFKPEYVTELGVGGFAGYAAGFAIKRAAQVVVFTTGCLFIGMQVMANHGYVTVHWDKIDKDWKGGLDKNGDGRVDRSDFGSHYDQVVKVLESGVPGAAGFSAGFLLGLRS